MADLAKSQGVGEQVAKYQPTGRMRIATAHEVAAPAAFLASEVAAITGANYTIDGGWTAE
jgi:NAD(P)-dependent dehydrogenase (short-subunit alcohol dehydrogenase family)